jgi:uncharacterized membrane protein YraQ (UPF0718 family)
MTLAYLFALLSTLLGIVLGLSGGQGRVSGPLRSFAFVAAIAVVFGQLIPEALGEIGPVALVVFVAGLLVPRLLFHHHHGPGHGHGHILGPDRYDDDGAHIRAGLLLSLVAMMLHQVGDGVALGAFASGAHAEHRHIDVFFAIAAHTVPVVGLLVHAFVQQWGRTIASLQGLALAVSGALGVGLADAINASAAVALTPFITAFAAGLLVHVVSHDRPPAAARDRFARVMDVLAVVAGVALVSQGGHAHGVHRDEHAESVLSVPHALVDLSLDVAPALLVGLLLAAVVRSQVARVPRAWLLRGGPMRQALLGALAGAPLPMCACGVLPVAHRMRRRGAAAAFVVAFLLAAPQLGVESLVITGRFLGWDLALLRLCGALAVATLAAYVTGRALGAQAPATATLESDFEVDAGESRWTRVASRLDELFVHILPFTMVGLLAAAYADVSLDAGAFDALRVGSLDVLVATLVSLPVYVCAASAAPLAAVLIAKGLSPGAALVGLVLGPTTSLATLGFMRATFGARATVVAIVGAVGATWALAYGVNALGVRPPPALALPGTHAHGATAFISLGLLTLALLRTVYKHGVNALFDGLKVSRFDAQQGHTQRGAAPGSNDGSQGHGHGHDAEHSH